MKLVGEKGYCSDQSVQATGGCGKDLAQQIVTG
jgi:hypothetical protein